MLYCVTGPGEGDKRLRFEYDHMGRRVRKTAESYNGSSWDVDTHLYFVYEPLRWNVLLVLDAADGSDQGTEPDYKILRKYTWGLDMSGQYGNPSESGIHGAGNIGGLLACVETDHEGNPDAGQFWFFYDANGNVTQVIYQDGSIKAHYEYDPYGHVINDLSSYTYAEDNPFRFSTKWLDNELITGDSGAIGLTGLYYYGYRYYSTNLGRWINRDPIEEVGGINLQAFVDNEPVMGVDSHGLKATRCVTCCYSERWRDHGDMYPDYRLETTYKWKCISCKTRRSGGSEQACKNLGYTGAAPLQKCRENDQWPAPSCGDEVKTVFWAASRTMKTSNLSGIDKIIANGINMCVEAHAGIVRMDDGVPVAAWGWSGTNAPPNMREDAGQWNVKETVRLDRVLTPPDDTSLEDIDTCLNNVPLPGNGVYNPPWNDCRHWRPKAVKECFR